MPDPKPSAKTLALDFILDALEMMLFFAKLALVTLIGLGVGAMCLGVPVQRLRAFAVDTVQRHGSEMLPALAALLGATLLAGALRAFWRRWPIFE